MDTRTTRRKRTNTDDNLNEIKSVMIRFVMIRLFRVVRVSILFPSYKYSTTELSRIPFDPFIRMVLP